MNDDLIVHWGNIALLALLTYIAYRILGKMPSSEGESA